MREIRGEDMGYGFESTYDAYLTLDFENIESYVGDWFKVNGWYWEFEKHPSTENKYRFRRLTSEEVREYESERHNNG